MLKPHAAQNSCSPRFQFARSSGHLIATVESIAYDSRRVQRNGMFVALRGEKADGHEFIGQAIEKGASVIVTEREEKNSARHLSGGREHAHRAG